MTHKREGRAEQYQYKAQFEGLLKMFEDWYKQTRNGYILEYIATFADDLSGNTEEHQRTIANLCFNVREDIFNKLKADGHNSFYANSQAAKLESNFHSRIVQLRNCVDNIIS